MNTLDFWLKAIPIGLTVVGLIWGICWAIYTYYKQNNPVIKIDVYTATGYDTHNTKINYNSRPTNLLYLKVTNLSKTPKYIEIPRFLFKKPIGEKKAMFVAKAVQDFANYPLKLEPGQQHLIYYDMVHFKEALQGYEPAEKIKAITTDTSKKMYYSKHWLSIQDIFNDNLKV